MAKIHVFSLVLFVRRQFKRWGSISNTTLGPSGHGRKPPSSRLGTLYSYHRQWFMIKKSMYWAWFYLSDVNSSIGGRFQTPHWAPVTMVWSPHRRCWGPCTAIVGNVLWQKSMYWAWFCFSDVNSSARGRFQAPHWAPVAMVGSHHRRGWGPFTAPIVNGLWQKSISLMLVFFVQHQFKRWGWFQTTHWAPVAMVRSHHRRGWGPCTVPIVNGLWQKPMYWG